MSIYPFFSDKAQPLQCCGAWIQFQMTLGAWWFTPCTGRQYITVTHGDNQPLTHAHTPMGALDALVNESCISLDYERMQIGRAHV